MTTYVIKVETNDIKDALDIVEVERNRGYTIWIEDEKGEKIDEGTVIKGGTQQLVPSLARSIYEKVLGLLILGIAVAIGIGILYALSLSAGD
jgi:hypothetical protein